MFLIISSLVLTLFNTAFLDGGMFYLVVVIK